MWLGLFFVYVDTVYGFYRYFLCLVGCFSMITWTPTVLSVLYIMHVFHIFVFAPVQRN